jgi:2'-5' RNA ligase superfamily
MEKHLFNEVYEFLLVLELPGPLQLRVEETRNELMKKFHIVQPQTGRPHISLVRFCATKRVERKINQRLGSIAAGEKAFQVDLFGFGGYPMHAIYIRIKNQQAVLQLINRLKKLRTLMKAGAEDPYFLHDPQVALAGRIDNAAYVAAMKEYEHNPFSGSFAADSFLLLKKKKDEKKYKVARRFLFEFAPAGARQQLLFN